MCDLQCRQVFSRWCERLQLLRRRHLPAERRSVRMCFLLDGDLLRIWVDGVHELQRRDLPIDIGRLGLLLMLVWDISDLIRRLSMCDLQCGILCERLWLRYFLVVRCLLRGVLCECRSERLHRVS